MNKELKKLIKAIKAVVFSGTPSDWRSIQNSLRPLKRLGFRWK